MYVPFDHKILGAARRFSYHRIAPKIIKARKLVKRSDADFRVVRRNRQYRFQASFKPSAADIEKIDMRDLIQVRSFMIKHGVRIIILPYYKAGWTQLIFLMKSKGYKYVYGNAHYILFFLTEVDDIA